MPRAGKSAIAEKDGVRIYCHTYILVVCLSVARECFTITATSAGILVNVTPYLRSDGLKKKTIRLHYRRHSASNNNNNNIGSKHKRGWRQFMFG